MNLNLFLGQGVDGRNVYWANAENAHISILGQSGTGKTYLISRLAKEACRQGFNVVIPDYSDSFLQMQDSCVLHTDIRKINLDILSNSKGRDVEARAEELISSIRLFCKIGIVKQDTIRQLAVSFLQENSTNETVPELISYCEKQLKASSEIEMIRNYLGLIVPISADAYTHVSICQPGMIHIIQFPYWMGSDQRLKYTEMILAQVWNEQICPCMASKPVIFILDEAHGLHLKHLVTGSFTHFLSSRYGEYQVLGKSACAWEPQKCSAISTDDCWYACWRFFLLQYIWECRLCKKHRYQSNPRRGKLQWFII